MKHRSNLSVLAIFAASVILLALAACQPAAAPQESAVNSDTARWIAMGDYYTALSGSRPARAEKADQARWDAMGNFYLAYAVGRPLVAIQADQARWTAMGEFYSKSASSAVVSKSN